MDNGADHHMSKDEFVEAREAGRLFGTVATGPCALRGPGWSFAGHGLILDGVTVAVFTGEEAELIADRCAHLLYTHGLVDAPDTIAGLG